MRKFDFAEGEFYHVYNRGVDKRNVFGSAHDLDRFFLSMQEFNSLVPIGSLYEKSFNKKQPKGQTSKSEKRKKSLVNFIAYCLNPNHYHFILEQVAESGVEKFMQRLGTGYTKYFNIKNKRTGSLFQGTFKAVHVDSNEYLLHLSAYVNLNNRVHQLGSLASKLVEGRSSWGEYLGNASASNHICKNNIILEQFKTKNEYKDFAEDALSGILQRKIEFAETERYLLEELGS